MKDKTLPDKEIIKALEDEIHLAEYVDSDYCSNVKLEIIKSALDLITRQQAEKEALIAGQETLQKYIAQQKIEIERLKEIIEYKDICIEACEDIKAEAYKDLRRSLKNLCTISLEL